MIGDVESSVGSTMTKKFAERYFNWLASQIKIEHAVPRDYDSLFRYLHSREFVWVVPNDDNRAIDALSLRREFWGEGNRYPRDGVSLLEVILALSRRLEFVAGGEKEVWAGQLIKNLKLDRMYDPISLRKMHRMEDTINGLIWRTYERDGSGGFFPLKNVKEDQTKVEIWYQMNAYVNEHTV
jgi:hypothetical protein